MNKRLTVEIFSCLLIFIMIGFSACVKDSCKQERTYTYYQPVYKTKEEVRTNIRNSTAHEIENPGKINIRGNYIFLNEIDKGIHIIDNSNPALPKNISFISIPGNMDIAVKGDILYADLYTDLVAIDISNAASVKLLKVIEGVFPHRYWGMGFSPNAQSDKIITEWVPRDTTIRESCDGNEMIAFSSFAGGDVFFSAEAKNSSVSKSPVGVGGSMSRFTIMNERLYTVGQAELDVFNIVNAKNPTHTGHVNLGWGIETIYPFKNNLFIGSQTGMFIFNVNNPDVPTPAGEFSHVRTCDPVIADDTHAYVTLRSGTTCQGFTNQLDILKLNNVNDPVHQKTYPLTNPHGLSKDGNLLFICDGNDGLKVFNAADVMDLKEVAHVTGIDTYDVIAMNKVALVIAKDGLYQYNYTNPADMKLLSRIGITRK
jgi:hypothetical protein